MSEAAAAPAGAAGLSWRSWALGAVVALYLVTRLLHLMRLPVFVDEAIHLDWAFRIRDTGQLVGLTDGGRYLPIWAYAVVAGGAADPLRAARLCSVASGLAAVLGLYWLGRVLDSAAAGLLAAFLYVAAPFTLFYDRMALVDSLLSALVVYALAFTVLWARTARPRWAVALALTVAAAGLTKLSGLLLLPLPATVALLSRSDRRVRLRAQLGVIYGIGAALLVPLFLDLGGTGRFFEENLWVLRPGTDESFIARNAQLAGAWLLAYLTPIGAVLVSLAAAWSLHRRERADLLLLSVAAGWCLFFVLAGGRYWFPRYMLPAVPPLLLLLARCAARAGRRAMGLVAALATVAWLRFDAALLADPARAPLPPVERSQYVYDWPSGYGLAEATQRLRQAAARQPIVVLRDRSSGSLKEGLDLMLRREKAGIEIVDAPMKAGDFTDTIDRLILAGRPVVLAVDEAADGRPLLSLDGRRALGPGAAFVKPDGQRRIALYAVAGDCGLGTGADGQDGLGVSLWMQGRRDEAVQLLAESLRRDGEDIRAGYNLNVARNAILRGR